MPEDILNNLDEFDVVEEIDENAMVTDAPPPPEPGPWQVKLALATDAVKDPAKLVGVDRFPAKCVGKIKTPGHLQIVLDLELQDPTGAKHRPKREWFNTMVFQGVKTSAVDTLLRALTGKAGVGLSNKQKIEMLYDLVAEGGVVAGIELDLRGEAVKVGPDGAVVKRKDADGNEVINTKTGEAYDEYDVATVKGKKLFGGRSFPVDENGKIIAQDLTDDNGNPVFVSWVVKKWVPAAV